MLLIATTAATAFDFSFTGLFCYVKDCLIHFYRPDVLPVLTDTSVFCCFLLGYWCMSPLAGFLSTVRVCGVGCL